MARQYSKALLVMDDLSEDHRLRALKIIKATGIDPAAKIVFTVTALLLAYLIFRYII